MREPEGNSVALLAGAAVLRARSETRARLHTVLARLPPPTLEDASSA